MGFLQSVKILFVVVSVVLILAGLALLIWPAFSASALCAALGVVFILCGAVRLAGYCANDLYRLAFQFDLAAGLLLIALGAALILRAPEAMTGLSLMIGVFALTDSALRLQTALDAKRFGLRNWPGILVFALCGGALGALLLIRPFGGRLLVRAMGAALAVGGVENLLLGLCAFRVPRRSSSPVVEVEAEYVIDED